MVRRVLPVQRVRDPLRGAAGVLGFVAIIHPPRCLGARSAETLSGLRRLIPAVAIAWGLDVFFTVQRRVRVAPRVCSECAGGFVRGLTGVK